MRRHAKASSAASTSGSSEGSGTASFRLLAILALAIASVLVFAAPALAGKVQSGHFASDGPGQAGEGSGDGQLDNPGQADVNDTTGNLYVADTANDRVEVFKPTANLPEYDSQVAITAPTGLAIDQDSGDVYVANAAGISKFTSGLTPIAVGWTDPGVTGNLAVDPSTGDLLVADTDGNLIRRFESDGTAAGTFAAERPIDLAANSTGEIFVVTSTGNVTAECGPTSVVKRFSAAGVEGASVGASLEYVGAVAVDPDDDSIVIAAWVNTYYCEGAVNNHLPEIATFDSSGAFVEASELSGSTEEPGLNGNALYAMIPGLAVQGGGSTNVYAVTKSPNHDQYGGTSVAILGEVAPLVETFPAFALDGGTEALLGGKVNPQNQPTDYWFEYGLTDGYGKNAPVTQDADAGSAQQYSLFTRKVTGLSPETTYHFRVVAKNSTGTTPGLDRTFTTGPLLAEPESCSNEAVRALQSNHSSGCRGWEQVTPIEKNFVDAGTTYLFPTPALSSPDGDSVVYFSNTAYSNPPAAQPFNPYMAKRGAADWSNEGISPPIMPTGGVQSKAPWGKFISPDLSKSLVLAANSAALTANTPLVYPQEKSLYIRDNIAGTYQLLTPSAPSNVPNRCFESTPVAVSPDFRHVLFANECGYTPDAVNAGGPAVVYKQNLYQWNADEPDTVQLVGYLPNESVDPGGAVAGGQNTFLRGRALHTLSDDGSRAFFNSPPNERTGGPLYVRENGTSTTLISATGSFQAATSSGSEVLFLDEGGLKRHNVDSGVTTSLAAGPTTEEGQNGVVEVSDDLSRVYFVDEKPLIPGKGTESGENLRHLYLSDHGTLRYVATLSREDHVTGSPNDSFEDHQADMTADGGRLAFLSKARLTAYDNAGYDEIYIYDAGSEEISCASCRGTGEPPSGNALFTPQGDGGLSFGNTKGDRHNFSVDGSRLFFETTDALSPEDTNGATDIYEFSDGRTTLITPGTGGDERGYLFGGASPSGDDIFFGTRNQVVAQDVDRLSDLYDARVGGGIMAQSETAAITPCEGQQCRGASTTPAATTSPVSREVRGSKNATPKKAKKKKQKKHHKKKQQKKTHHKKKHKGKQQKKHKTSHRAHRNG